MLSPHTRIGSLRRSVGAAAWILCVVPMGVWAQWPAEPPAAYPGRLVVKYRQVDGCVHCVLAQGRSMASVTGSDSLDRLHAQFHVTGASSLFTDDHSPAGGRRARWQARVDAVRRRFPRRAARGDAAGAPDLSSVYLLEMGADVDVEAAAARYAADPNVEWAEPDRRWSAVLTPNDPFFGSIGTWGQPYRDLWGLETLDAATAWDRSIGTGVLVATIDTGVDYTHADLAADLWTNTGEVPGNGIDDDGNGYVDDVRGWDFADGDADPYDDNGHGTHVAGTIVGVGNNARGVVGVAWGARLMPVRGLDRTGTGYTSQLATALVYAAENGADVLSNSWGGFGHSSALQDAVTTARGLGVVVVAAAGNASADVTAFEPAGLAGVIAVGAITPAGARADFSNVGTALSVAAPGVDVLSCRSHDAGPVGGSIVATDYLRLSGTSMACPHAAGVAALLLADQPSLTADEVQWHLELSANQPGAVGWEGQRWNPYLGFGILDAAHVFDPVPVTTRLRSPALDLHGFVDEVRLHAASAPLVFTSTVPVPWSTTAPAWLVPTPSGGTTGGTVDFGLDLTGMAAGTTSQGTFVVSAPSALDGGGSIDATVHAHRDERIGGVFPIGGPYMDGSRPAFPPPAVASDGLGTLVAWSEEVQGSSELWAARVDGAGQVSSVTVHAGFPQKEQVAVAFDGRNYLIAWKSSPYLSGRYYDDISAMRVASDGQPIDAAPIVLRQQPDRGVLVTLLSGVAFDGEAYLVVWAEVDADSNRGKVLLQRVGSDGSIREKKPVTLYPTPSTSTNDVNLFITPRIACAATSCLLAWNVRDGEVGPSGAFVDKVFAARLAHGRFVDAAPFLAVRDVPYLADLTSDETDYMLLGHRFSTASGPVIVGGQVVTARVRTDGVAVDPNGVRLDNGYDGPTLFPKGTGLAFDGTDYVGVMTGSGTAIGTQLFVNRISPSAQVLETETEGLLAVAHGVETESSTDYAAISARHTDSLVVWSESVDDPTRPWRNQLYGQRLLAHPSGLPTVTLGSIGARQVAEGQTLVFMIVASGLDPSTAVYTASGLPPGAVFDPATHAFRWMPAGDEAGLGVTSHFEATDGSQVTAEDVLLTVTEAVPSVSGTIRAADAVTPAPGVGVQLTGAAKWTGHADAAGRYRFEGLRPGRYRVKLDRASRKLYRATPVIVRLTMGATDVTGQDLVVTPK